MKALFKSVNLIGDALYIGPALRAWIRQHQHENLDIWLYTLNDHVAPLYAGMVRDLHVKFHTMFEKPLDQVADFEHTFDVNAAFKLSDQKKQHLATSYADLLGVKIGDEKQDLKPIYIPEDSGANDSKLDGCVLISMFSASCTGRDPKCNYVPNKMLPSDKWILMLRYLRSTFRDVPIIALGAPTDKLPEWNPAFFDPWPEIIPMFGIPLNQLALIMKKAKLLVTIDNGMSHLGASQETPTFLMYPVALGAHYILPVGNPNLVWVHMNPVTVDPEYLLKGLQFACSKFDRTIWRKK